MLPGKHLAGDGVVATCCRALNRLQSAQYLPCHRGWRPRHTRDQAT
jgi:hypothetical protein